MGTVPLDALFSMIESPTLLSLVSIANGLEMLVATLDQQSPVAELSLHHRDKDSLESVARRFLEILSTVDETSAPRYDIAALVYVRHLIENGVDVRAILEHVAEVSGLTWSARFLRALSAATKTGNVAASKGDNVLWMPLLPRSENLTPDGDAAPTTYPDRTAPDTLPGISLLHGAAFGPEMFLEHLKISSTGSGAVNTVHRVDLPQ